MIPAYLFDQNAYLLATAYFAVAWMTAFVIRVAFEEWDVPWGTLAAIFWPLAWVIYFVLLILSVVITVLVSLYKTYPALQKATLLLFDAVCWVGPRLLPSYWADRLLSASKKALESRRREEGH